MVRTLFPINFRPPWPFIKKGAAGHRKIGPFVFEKYKWPGQNKEFPELSPKFMKNNREELRSRSFYICFFLSFLRYMHSCKIQK